MMVEPGMDVLLEKVDSKYTLVSVSAKRAREIMKKDGTDTENPVSVALHQIADGKVLWQREEDIPREEAAQPEDDPAEAAPAEAAPAEEIPAAEPPAEDEASEAEND